MSHGVSSQGGKQPQALSLLSGSRPRNVSWKAAAGLLFGDWGTSRLYVLGLAFLVAGKTSFWLISAMSLLILAVAWGYSQICRIYPDGGGVYSAARHKSRLLAVVGALLLFADYTVTASLSAMDAFHYFLSPPAQVTNKFPDDGKIHISHDEGAGESSALFTWPPSPGMLAIGAIIIIGGFNWLGPKHTSGFAIFAAVGMVIITLLLVVFAIPQIHWSQLDFGNLFKATDKPIQIWEAFVFIVLALSGVEAIANLTGVMHRPVAKTARKSIWVVAIEVAVFNLILCIAMINLGPDREAHYEDMLAYLAHSYTSPYLGQMGEWAVRILGGVLLLSATNTALTDMISVQYLMARDGELPLILQALNGFGTPWLATLIATAVPCMVLLVFHDLKTLAALYAIGVIGAVAINVTLTAMHPRLRKWWRKGAAYALGVLLLAIWVTLAFTKIPALQFVTVVLLVGLSLRQITKWHASKHPKPSLLRRAIMEQLPESALAKPRIMLATAGAATNAEAAIAQAKVLDAALVVSFIRELSISLKGESQYRFSLDNDPAAQHLFKQFLEMGHNAGVPIIPAYDTADSAPEAIAEIAAMNNVSMLLIGSSRRGALHQLIKGSFQRKLESLLPEGISVGVLGAPEGQYSPA